MAAPATVTATLAAFVASHRAEDVPPAVVHEAKRSLLNFLAVALAGCSDPTLDIAARVLHRFRSGSQATVIGRDERTDLLNAACLNAMAANVYDFDDTHVPTIIHPTAPVAPALLALAEQAPISGRAWLHAFILGVEVECRAGDAISPEHYRRGWHITSTCGVLGAAAAAARLLGLDAQRTAWSLGHAAAQSGGLVVGLGTMSKSISVGHAASNGLLSALLAAEGFDGPEAPLEGEHGWLHVVGEQPRTDAMVRDLGERWELQKNSYKPYPCGVVLNPVIEACLAVRRDADLSLDRIETIELVGNPLLRLRTDRPAPATGRLSQVSAQHAVGVVLTTGRAGLDAFSDAAVRETQVLSLGAKVRFTDDATIPVEAVRLVIRQQGGATVAHSVAQAEGSLARPLSDAQLEAKLRDLVLHGRSGCDADAIATMVWQLEALPDISPLLRLVAGRACQHLQEQT